METEQRVRHSEEIVGNSKMRNGRKLGAEILSTIGSAKQQRLRPTSRFCPSVRHDSLEELAEGLQMYSTSLLRGPYQLE